jgi:hypothetical protein
MNRSQHRIKRLNKYLAKLQARLRAADRNTARLTAVCQAMSGELRAEWDELLGFYIYFASHCKEELDDFTRMRDETLRMKKELEELRPQSGLEKQQIENEISALLGAFLMHLEQVVVNFEETHTAFHAYESALKAVEYER